MNKLFVAVALAASIIAAPVFADGAPAPAPAAAALSTSTTSIGDLIDNPAAKAILDKHVPGFADNPQLSMARGMTMKQIQAFAGDALKDEVLAKIDADLAALK